MKKQLINNFTEMSELAISQQKRSNSRKSRKAGLLQHRSQNLDDLVNKQQTFGKATMHRQSPNNFDTSDSRLNEDNLLGEI